MTVTVERKPFAKTLSAFKGIVANRHIPILDCIRMVAGKGLLTIEGTNLDQRLRLTVPADGDLKAVAVPYLRLERFVSGLDAADVMLEPGKDALTVRARRSRATIPTMHDDTWPAGDDTIAATPVILSRQTIRNIVGFCASAVYDGAERSHLQGICFDGERAAAVAYFGHGIAVYPLAAMKGFPQRPIIPAAALEKFAALSGDADAEILVDDHSIRLVSDGIDLRSKLIDGTFPDWTRGVPDGGAHTLRIGRQELDSALARLIATSGTAIIGLALTGNSLHLRARDRVVTSADCNEEIECDATGDAVSFGLNGSYVRDALAALKVASPDSADLNIRLTGRNTGAVVFTVDGSDAVRAIMPLNPHVYPDIAPVAVAA